jgi:hypothetical protein
VISDWLVIIDSGLLIAGRSVAAPASNPQSPITNQQRINNPRSDNQQ